MTSLHIIIIIFIFQIKYPDNIQTTLLRNILNVTLYHYLYLLRTWIFLELNITQLCEQTRDPVMMRSMLELLLEGFIMLVVAISGVFLNISSVIYFAQLRQQRPFHRFVFPSFLPQFSWRVSTPSGFC